MKFNEILLKFGHPQLKFSPKLTLRKLKKNTSCSPDVGEDDGVWVSKGKNRVAK